MGLRRERGRKVPLEDRGGDIYGGYIWGIYNTIIGVCILEDTREGVRP